MHCIEDNYIFQYSISTVVNIEFPEHDVLYTFQGAFSFCAEDVCEDQPVKVKSVDKDSDSLRKGYQTMSGIVKEAFTEIEVN